MFRKVTTARFYAWTKSKMAAFAKHSRGEEIGEELLRIEGEFRDYLQEQIRLRRAAPVASNDLIQRMISTADEGGLRLTDDQVIANTIFLLNAGNQTTANLMVNLIWQLLSTGQYQNVRADRALLPLAIEESLRVTPPIQFGVRQAVEDLEIGGVAVGAGEMLIMSNVSADRDETIWGGGADAFDLSREHPARHLGFGMGTHACLGAPVARRTVQLAVTALFDRYPELELAPDFTYEKQEYWTSLGPTRLDVIASAV